MAVTGGGEEVEKDLLLPEVQLFCRRCNGGKGAKRWQFLTAQTVTRKLKSTLGGRARVVGQYYDRRSQRGAYLTTTISLSTGEK